MKNRKKQRRIAALLTVLLFSAACFSVSAKAADDAQRYLVPVGHAVGIKLFSDGVMVVKLAEEIGGGESPASRCGLKTGDMIESVNGVAVNSTEELQECLQKEGGEPLELTVSRSGKRLCLSATAARNDEGVYCLGAWIRDSMAGIGTVTFYDPQSGRFGALGHGITDVDTLLLMPLGDGAIMDAQVKAVLRGEKGAPGELRGSFDAELGSLQSNTDAGVFGTVWAEPGDFLAHEMLPVASSGEIHTGKATILANVSGDAVEEYDVEISRVYHALPGNRNLLLRVTDERLLDITGGIVQGMSGSPILQDGKFIGAVTHVLVNDPTKGYGIFIENMLDAAG